MIVPSEYLNVFIICFFTFDAKYFELNLNYLLQQNLHELTNVIYFQHKLNFKFIHSEQIYRKLQNM